MSINSQSGVEKEKLRKKEFQFIGKYNLDNWIYNWIG